MPFSRLVRMRSRTSAMSASRSTGVCSPMSPKSNDGAPPARGLGADRRRRARPRPARADRVLTLRRGTAEASLVHSVLIRADLVLEVITGAVDHDGHDAIRRET